MAVYKVYLEDNTCILCSHKFTNRAYYFSKSYAYKYFTLRNKKIVTQEKLGVKSKKCLLVSGNFQISESSI